MALPPPPGQIADLAATKSKEPAFDIDFAEIPVTPVRRMMEVISDRAASERQLTEVRLWGMLGGGGLAVNRQCMV